MGIFKKPSKGNKGGVRNDSRPPDDELLQEQVRQHKREQIKRDGFDFDAELQRMAEDNDEDR